MAEGLKLLTEEQNVLLEEFCKTFPAVVNDKRPTGDLRFTLNPEVLDSIRLVEQYLNMKWSLNGWENLSQASQMSEFMLFRTAQNELFVMPFFRKIGFQPYEDKEGVIHNDEPYWWLNENNYWKKTLRFLKNCEQVEVPNRNFLGIVADQSFCVQVSNLNGKSLSEVRQGFEALMEQSLVENKIPSQTNSLKLWVSKIEFKVPFLVYRSSQKSMVRTEFNRLALSIHGNNYKSVSVVPFSETPRMKFFRGESSDDWLFLRPIQRNSQVLNWSVLSPEQFQKFIAEIPQ